MIKPLPTALITWSLLPKDSQGSQGLWGIYQLLTPGGRLLLQKVLPKTAAAEPLRAAGIL